MIWSTFYSPTSKSHSLAWATDRHIYHLKIPADSSQSLETVLRKPKPERLHYDRYGNSPIRHPEHILEKLNGIHLSEFHYYLVHKDCITVMSLITKKFVACIELASSIQRTTVDKSSDTLFLHSPHFVAELSIENETKNLWKLYTEDGKFQEAYIIAKRFNEPNKEHMAFLFAEDLFNKKRYREAAEIYMETELGFEEIMMKFLTNEEAYKGSKLFLERWLQKREAGVEKQCVLSLLMELHLNHTNETERLDHCASRFPEFKPDSEVSTNFQEARKDLSSFIDHNFNEIERSLAMTLLQSHGRWEDCINYSNKKNDQDVVLVHFMNEEEFDMVMEKLQLLSEEKVYDFVYRYSHVLFQQKPHLICKLLTSKFPRFEPTKLITGLMQIPKDKRASGVEFLQWMTEKKERKCRDKTIHNILFFFLVDMEDFEAVESYLIRQEKYLETRELVFFDIEFAFRLCDDKKMKRAIIYLYGMMGLHSEAVSKSLEDSFDDLAAKYANKPENLVIKKKLWIQVALFETPLTSIFLLSC